jgi:hypothetical protein
MAKLIGRYFFLTGFLAGAFFFAGIVLLSLGLDFAGVPGFLVTGIRLSSSAVAAAGRAPKLNELLPIGLWHYRNALWRIQELCAVFIKKF